MSGLLVWLGQRRKAIAALLAAVLTWAGVALVPDPPPGEPRVTALEWYLLALALGGVFGVHAVPNDLTAGQLQQAAQGRAGVYPTRPTYEPGRPTGV